MAWISDDRYLSQSEMENNANIIIAYYRSIGINDCTIAAILGNIQAESTLSPVLTERGSSNPGYGLVQWTPKSDLINACSTLGLSPYTSGDVQIQVIIKEIQGNPSSINQWYTTSGFISNYYNSGASSDMIGITPSQFLSNSMGWNPEKLAIMFMAGYERPNYNPDKNHYTQRQANASAWYSYMGGSSSTYVPRLDDTGIEGNFHYYSQNPFYLAGYGMPNCTCYAWGRFWEIGDPNNDGSNRPTLPTGDAGTWFGNTQDGYERGQTPKLGAVACFSRNGGGAGHVAIVEKIESNGDITTSNSAWQSTFFYLSNLSASNGYNTSNYTFQGFIYNPFASQGGGGGGGGDDPTPTNKKKGFKFVLSQGKKRRNLLYG